MKPELNYTKIGVIGLGYVGLPLAVEFGHYYPAVGFDINEKCIAELKAGKDRTLECSAEELKLADKLSYTAKLDALRECNAFIVTVPMPVDKHNRPDLTPLIKASETLGKVIKKNDVVIYESTVYPGATEEDCIPVIEKVSGLKFNVDFFAGYSPERINPGDKEHRFTTIKKVTSGSTLEIADYVDALYASVVTAGTHKASSIKVAEAAKVIENTQRDVNIALINELALIFNRMGIDTEEVLKAAGSKWNLLPYRPGLVGGHCIGVDPYYLTHKAQELGYHAEVIRAGRRSPRDWRHTPSDQPGCGYSGCRQGLSCAERERLRQPPQNMDASVSWRCHTLPGQLFGLEKDDRSCSRGHAASRRVARRARNLRRSTTNDDIAIKNWRQKPPQFILLKPKNNSKPDIEVIATYAAL